MVLLLLCISSTLLARGTIRGIISDSLSAERLVGVNVYLVGTALGSATDLEGQYRIVGVPDGRYTLRISYIGYKMKNIPITVESDQLVRQDVKLAFDVIEGSVVEVTAQAEGQGRYQPANYLEYYCQCYL
jgi:hypothetical protein